MHPVGCLENVADVSKARRVWLAAQVSLEEGVDRLVAWYLQERAWVKDVETP